jgi:hypothetical protein
LPKHNVYHAKVEIVDLQHQIADFIGGLIKIGSGSRLILNAARSFLKRGKDKAITFCEIGISAKGLQDHRMGHAVALMAESRNPSQERLAVIGNAAQHRKAIECRSHETNLLAQRAREVERGVRCPEMSVDYIDQGIKTKIDHTPFGCDPTYP